MAKIKITSTKQAEVKYLRVSAGVRYWEDAEVDGVEDLDGSLIPHRQGDRWYPLIDIDTGIIEDWPKGITASLHYKVCDDGIYTLLGPREAGTMDIINVYNGYVPSILCPEESGHGDYIIMEIDGEGRIKGWKPDLSQFEEQS
jgi:hypothetical protein